MKILQTNLFKKSLKTLHANQKKTLDDVIRSIIENPLIGAQKDLANVYVYKFRMIDQLTLLAYIYDSENASITLLALGAHENFYRDLKNHIN